MSQTDGQPELPDTWLEAANEASFAFFEVASPTPDSRRAGGYGYSADGPVSLEVLGEFDGGEVSVETTDIGHGIPNEVRRPLLLHDLAARLFHLVSDDVELPLTVTFDSEDRTIVVDGEPVRFEGYSASEQGWAGVADLADGKQVVVRVSGRMGPDRLTHCTDWAMPD